jgi:hypothetical protein
MKASSFQQVRARAQLAVSPHTIMNRLLEIGFEPAGHWVLENQALSFELVRHSSQRNVLYAFICDGHVKYVGKTVRSLATRMAGYKRPGPTQSTNIRNHARIMQVLALGAAVEILVLPDNGLLHYGKFHLNLAAGLEDDIIRLLNPEWNGGASEEITTSTTDEVVAVPGSNHGMSSSGTFSFVLQPTYYRTGFFNVGVSSQKFFGADGETIELFLGNSQQPILGAINRHANLNGTPRIMGGAGLRDWFNANAAVSGEIIVEVLSPTAIRLNAQ